MSGTATRRSTLLPLSQVALTAQRRRGLLKEPLLVLLPDPWLDQITFEFPVAPAALNPEVTGLESQTEFRQGAQLVIAAVDAFVRENERRPLGGDQGARRVGGHFGPLLAIHLTSTCKAFS